MTDAVFVAMANNAGALTSISNAINKHTNYKTECVMTWMDNYIKYPGGKCLQDTETQDWLQEAMKDVQTLIFTMHHPMCYLPSFDFSPYIKTRRLILTHHGTKLRQQPITSKGMYHRVFASPELTRYGEFIEFLPRPLNVPILPSISKRENFTIGHDVTSYDNLGEYVDKIKKPELYPNIPRHETLKTSLTLFQQCRLNGVRFEAHGGMPWLESIRHKAEMTAYYDQLWAGETGIAALEAMYYDVPVISYLAPQTLDVMRLFGEEPPLINTHYDDFPQTFKHHLKENDWNEIGKDCGKWVKDYYDPAKCAKLWAEALFA